MKFRNILLLLLALGSTSVAYAAEGGRPAWYVGLTASSFNFERTGTLSHSYNTHGYTGVLGVDLGPYFALEARGGQGDSDKDSNGLSFQARELSAAYVRVNLPLDGGKVLVYALGGFASINVKAELGALSHTKSITDNSYGVGLEVYGNRSTALRVEYTRYLFNKNYTDAALGLANDNFDVNALSFGIVHHF